MGFFERIINDMKVAAGVSASPPAMRLDKGLENHYRMECVRGGKVIWVEEFDNLVVDAGLNDSLDKHLKGASYTAAWYVGLASSSPTFAAGDTMSSHSGWTEVVGYSDSARRTLTLGTVASKSVDNSASKAVFNINASVTAGGAFVASDATKSGTSGVLYGGGVFSQNRSLISGDVLNVTITLTAAAA
jgi:hypothetical protein